MSKCRPSLQLQYKLRCIYIEPDWYNRTHSQWHDDHEDGEREFIELNHVVKQAFYLKPKEEQRYNGISPTLRMTYWPPEGEEEEKDDDSRLEDLYLVHFYHLYQKDDHWDKWQKDYPRPKEQLISLKEVVDAALKLPDLKSVEFRPHFFIHSMPLKNFKVKHPKKEWLK